MFSHELKERCLHKPTLGAGCWYSEGLVIERLGVRIPAGAAGELSSPELTLCSDSYSVLPQWHVKD